MQNVVRSKFVIIVVQKYLHSTKFCLILLSYSQQSYIHIIHYSMVLAVTNNMIKDINKSGQRLVSSKLNYTLMESFD